MSTPPILVIGSVVIDRVLYADSLPTPGTTVLGNRLEKHLGGKGLNQAVQIHRLELPVTFVGAVGTDDDGQWALAKLQKTKFPYPFLKRLDTYTGSALICVDGTGQNQIGVGPGANKMLDSDHAREALESLGPDGFVVASLEVPLETLTDLFVAARQKNYRIIVNAAPWQACPEVWGGLVNAWIFNDEEAAGCFGDIPKEGGIPHIPLMELADWIAITHGAQGASIITRDATYYAGAPDVETIDTVAAGDSFVGALVAARVRKLDWNDALNYAVRCASLATTKSGAIPSLPTRKALQALIDKLDA